RRRPARSGRGPGVAPGTRWDRTRTSTPCPAHGARATRPRPKRCRAGATRRYGNPIMCPTVPEKPSLDGLEPKWMARWEEEGTYRFDRTRTRAEIYSVDTPPPTVSGTLHVGSAFSYTHTDLVVRFQRMRGREVYYPMGWDDNGLPTERRVQNFFGVACDPSLPYDPDFRPPQRPGRNPVPVSRPNFVELCHRLTAEDERAFEVLWRRLGLPVDRSWTYATIDERSHRASPRSLRRNVAQGAAYQADAPT